MSRRESLESQRLLGHGCRLDWIRTGPGAHKEVRGEQLGRRAQGEVGNRRQNQEKRMGVVFGT